MRIRPLILWTGRARCGLKPVPLGIVLRRKIPIRSLTVHLRAFAVVKGRVDVQPHAGVRSPDINRSW